MVWKITFFILFFFYFFFQSHIPTLLDLPVDDYSIEVEMHSVHVCLHVCIPGLLEVVR